MATLVRLGDMAVDVVLKDIKHIHLSVHPPAGRVRIAAPTRMSLDTIRVFAISKLRWIKDQQQKLRGQVREPRREYLESESHYLWGRRYLLKVRETTGTPSVSLTPRRLLLDVRSGTSAAKRETLLDAWYREQLRDATALLVAKWEPVLRVKVRRVFLQRMKTRWGSCNPSAGSIRLNTELAKKPRECLEYIVVHEMLHMIEPTHGDRFVTLMTRFMPHWRFRREQLNRLPVRHENWDY